MKSIFPQGYVTRCRISPILFQRSPVTNRLTAVIRPRSAITGNNPESCRILLRTRIPFAKKLCSVFIFSARTSFASQVPIQSLTAAFLNCTKYRFLAYRRFSADLLLLLLARRCRTLLLPAHQYVGPQRSLPVTNRRLQQNPRSGTKGGLPTQHLSNLCQDAIIISPTQTVVFVTS